jgi:hypothetical protein
MSVLSAAPKLVVTPTSVSERILADEQPKASERRVSTRVPAELVPSITGVRLSPFGGTSALVNISTSGLLVKGDRRVLLGTALSISFAGTFSPATARGRVARCEVRSIEAGVVWYDIAIAFDSPIPLEEPRKEEPPNQEEVAARSEQKEFTMPEPRVEVPAAPQDPGPLLYNRW